VEIKAGQRLRSQVDSTEVIVVKAVAGEVDLRCGGAEMIDIKAVAAGDLVLVDDGGGGSKLGKRYTNEGGVLELLVTKAGAGTLAVASTPLVLKEAKPLPSSD